MIHHKPGVAACRARHALLILLVAVMAGPALGQGADPQAGEQHVLGPYAWVVELGVPGVLTAGFLGLWAYFQGQAKDYKEERAAWAAEKQRLLVDHEREKTKLKEDHEREVSRLWEATRKEKTELRSQFEAERLQLFTRLDSEQKERREGNEQLLREQNDLMREVMNTAQAMTHSLDENTRVVAKFTQHVERGS